MDKLHFIQNANLVFVRRLFTFLNFKASRKGWEVVASNVLFSIP